MAAFQHFAPEVVGRLLVGGQLGIAALEQSLLVRLARDGHLRLGAERREAKNQSGYIAIHHRLP